MCQSMSYHADVGRIAPGSVGLDPQSRIWSQAPVLSIEHFRPEGSDHRPRTSLQLFHDNHSILGLFRVHDRYVRYTFSKCGDPVYRDSCVEFFVKPKEACGYFNFEWNCGGTLLCSYITDWTRLPSGGFQEATRLTAEELGPVRVATSLPRTMESEITDPLVWWLAFEIPVVVMERFVGPIGSLSGQTWRGNAYKCGSGTSHPHWAAWAPVDELNFHLPRCFGELLFA